MDRRVKELRHFNIQDAAKTYYMIIGVSILLEHVERQVTANRSHSLLEHLNFTCKAIVLLERVTNSTP
jgi:hypothetical protein